MNGTVTLTYKWARRIAISLIGGTVLIAGVAMTVLPGPAVVVIPLGLGILGLEFAWARRWLRRVKERAQQFMPGLAGAQAAQRGADDSQGSGMSQPQGSGMSQPPATPASSVPATSRSSPHSPTGGTPDRIR